MLDNTADWCYAGEGKLKVAFINSNARGTYCDKVLLIWKQLHQGFSRSRDFETDVMRKLLPDAYSSFPVQQIVLTDEIVEKLTAVAVKSRPAGRQLSGQLQLQSISEVQPNYTRVYRSLPQFATYHCPHQELSVELKVKCGLKATSPFIPAHRRVKLQMSRYQLIQCTKDKHATTSTDGCLSWGKYVGHSSYMPEDLCSGETKRVRKSLGALTCNPQNNLRINVNGEHYFGWDRVDPRPLHDQLAGESWYQWLGGVENPLDGLVGVTSAILSTEGLLQCLQRLQELDVLDVEGAALVHKRVVELCHGSFEEARRYLEQHLTSCTADWRALLTAGNQCQGASIVHRLRSLPIDELMSLQEWQARREKATWIVEQATLEECAQLLQLFMVSLVARDASVVVALRGAYWSYPSSAPQDDCAVALPQSEALCGVVSLAVSRRKNGAGLEKCGTARSHDVVADNCLVAKPCFAYTVGIIDLGLKDLDKLWRKDLEEDEICEAAARALIE